MAGSVSTWKGTLVDRIAMASCSADTVGSEQTQRYSKSIAPGRVMAPLTQGLTQKRQRRHEHQHRPGLQPLGCPQLNERLTGAAGHDDCRARMGLQGVGNARQHLRLIRSRRRTRPFDRTLVQPNAAATG